MIYILYDKPKELEDMSFLTTEFKCDYREIYPEKPCISIMQMVSICKKVLDCTKAEDTIVCWYDFMGVLCWWLGKFFNKNIKVIAINILLKDKNTVKNKFAKYLYKKALTSKSFIATVTTKAYGEYINNLLKIKTSLVVLHDVYHESYTLNGKMNAEKNTVFCGGRNGRDWKMIFDIAKVLPTVTFNCVMPYALSKRFSDITGENICIKTDISKDEFMKLLCQSQLVVMPLDTEAPAGLTVCFQAAANSKMLIMSDTVTTKEYLSHGRGSLCKSSVKEWKEKIQYYLYHEDEAEICATKFKNFLKNECSEEKYAKMLWEILEKKGN